MTTWMKQTILNNEIYQINETLFMNEINHKHVVSIFDCPIMKKKKEGLIKLCIVPK
jgi:hypothetical protein